MPSSIIKGLATIVWGSGNVLGTPSGAVVETGTITPKNGEPIEIEDNNGFALAQVILDDGFNAKFNCLYDSAKVWPQVGANVVLTLPNTAAANANAVSYTCLVGAQPEQTFGRKKELMMSFSVTYRPGVSV